MDRRSLLAFGALMALGIHGAQSQTSSQAWPQRSVRFIVPLGPGSRAPPELFPEATTFPPVSTPSCEFRHVISGSLALVSPDLT